MIHQHGRKRDEKGRLITEKQDIELAIDLMFDSIVLKVDELNGRLRDFYEKVKDFVLQHGKEYEFSRMEIRQFLGKSVSQIRRDLDALEETEYIYRTFSSKHNTYVYKVAFWDSLEALRNKIKEILNKQLSSL